MKDDANYLLFGDRICRDVKELDEFCRSRFQDSQKNVDEFRYFWIDDDGDEIRVTTDVDYCSFLQAMANTKARLYVVEKTTTSVELGNQEETDAVQAEADDDAPMQNDATGVVDSSRPLHQNVICDVCDEEIVGHRYKCLICHDYDLCMKCEAKFRHKDHLMLRIPTPALVCRSHPLVPRMFDKLRMYSARMTSIAEKEAAVQEPVVIGGPGNGGTNDAYGMKRANARNGHRSKHSEERRKNIELLKASRYGKTSVDADHKKNSAAAETSGERSTKETKETPPSPPTVSEITKRCRDVMYMYLNAGQAWDRTGNRVALSTTDHIAVANLAAATASAAASRAKAVASKLYQANIASNASCKELDQMMLHAEASMQPPKTEPTTTAPTPTPIMPIPFLPFVNLTWPTQEKLMVASENVSKLLDPLGLSFEIRHKSVAGSPSTSPDATPKTPCAPVTSTSDASDPPALSETVVEATTSLPHESLDKKQDKTIQTKEPQQLAATIAELSNAAQKLKEYAETEKSNSAEKEAQKNPSSGTLLESDSVGVEKAEAAVANEPDDEDDSQNTSSASLLTDDDQDLLEVEEEGKGNSSSSSKTPKAAEKSWTLIDIPHEHDDAKIAANVPLDAIAKLIGYDIPSTTDVEEPAQPLAASKERKKDKPAEESKPKEMKKNRKTIVDRMEESERSQSASAQMKEIMNILTPPTNSGPSSSVASSSSAGRSGKSSRKSSTTQKDFTIYSHRPHVNHAIHTMMTMGFSNHNGWLTQLLESLNGDIPKALDLLLQHRH